MDNKFFAFTGGEYAPELTARSDLDRYDLGAASLTNFVVKYTGGVWKRPGTRFIDNSFTGQDARLFAFRLSDTAAESYLMVLGDEVLWLYQNETLVNTFVTPYALTDIRTLSFSQEKKTIRITHPLYPRYTLSKSSGSWVFGLQALEGGEPLEQTPLIADSGAYVRYVRVIDGGTGYTSASVVDMTDATGSGFVAIPTISSGAITAVTIIEAGSGYTAPALTADIGADATFEIGLASTDAGFIMTATAVYADGTESGPMRPAVIRDSINFTQTLGSATYTWTAVSGAVKYRVYRSIIIPDGAEMHAGFSMGYVGETRATSFTDNNITPDFTQTPSRYNNPFAAGAIESIIPTSPGSGYLDTSIVTVTDPTGSNIVAYPAVVDGELVGIIITHPGEGYTAPVVSVSDGTGAVFEVEVSALDNVNPAASCLFQRRTVYAGTYNDPMTLWATRNEARKGFNESSIVTSSDPFTYEVDSDAVIPIKAVLAGRNGLLVFTSSGVSMLAAAEGLSVTALNGVLDPQSSYGIAEAPPVFLGEDIAYVQTQNSGMRMLSFNANARKFDVREMSTYSPHFFKGVGVRSLAFALTSMKLGFGVYEDGTAFSCTVDRSQEVYAYTPIWTEGRILDVVAAEFDGAQKFYFLVLRRYGNTDKITLEALREESPARIEDEVHLDSSLQTYPDTPNATVTLSGVTGTIEVLSDADVFVGAEGQAFSAGNGRGVVQSVISPRKITVTLIRDVDTPVRNYRYLQFAAGDWWIAPFVTTVTGIPHEGQYVSVVGDAKQQSRKLVVGGAITLDEPAAVVHTGLAFGVKFKSLPIANTEGYRHRITSAVVLTGRVGSFTIGGYEVAKRTNEPWSASTDFTGRSEFAHVATGWSIDNAIEIESDNALPCQILRIVALFDGGDYKPARGGG